MFKDDKQRENAEALAIRALGFVASDAELLPRFIETIKSYLGDA